MASSVTALLRQLVHLELSAADVDVVDTFLTSLYDTYHLPKGGCVPQITGGLLGFVPIYERRFIGVDPLTNTLSRLYVNIARLPLRGKVEWDMGEMLTQHTFRCNSSKILRHLVCLGYLEQEKVSTYVFGQDGLTQLIQEYTEPDPLIYDYVVKSELPMWLTDYVESNS
jgi:hypothetical protein